MILLGICDCLVMLLSLKADYVCLSFSVNISVSDRDLGKGGTVEHTFDKHSIDLEPGNPVRAELASLLVGNRTTPVYVHSLEGWFCEHKCFVFFFIIAVTYR